MKFVRAVSILPSRLMNKPQPNFFWWTSFNLKAKLTKVDNPYNLTKYIIDEVSMGLVSLQIPEFIDPDQKFARKVELINMREAD